jgi:hypothetical protein
VDEPIRGRRKSEIVYPPGEELGVLSPGSKPQPLSNTRVDPATADPLFLEINRRVRPARHRGEARNVDLCAALYAAVHGTASSSRSSLDAGEEGISVHFPQEWLRDLDSPWLRAYPSDVPWDEPELFEA